MSPLAAVTVKPAPAVILVTPSLAIVAILLDLVTAIPLPAATSSPEIEAEPQERLPEPSVINTSSAVPS